MDPLLAAPILSILSAMMFSIGNLFLGYGLRTSTPMVSTLTLAFVTLLIFGPVAVLTFRQEGFPLTGVLILVAAGMASPGVSRTLLSMSFGRIGLSRSVTISNAAPLVAVIFGVALLGERPTYLIYIGTVSIIVGVSCLTMEEAPADPKKRLPRFAWYNYTLAFLAMVTLGLAGTLRKMGISALPSLSAALSLGALGSLLALAAWYPFLSEKDSSVKTSWHGMGYFLGSALFTCAAILGFFAALQRGSLSVVMPLICTVPLFTLVLSWLFLRKVERLNYRIALGALLVSCGAALVAIS
jgi:uncharacterized membrane protein